MTEENQTQIVERRRAVIMIDVESWDTGPRSVLWQIALSVGDIDEEEILPDFAENFYLPIQPQLDFVQPRTISASTILWWMDQPDEARQKMRNCVHQDISTLVLMVTQFAGSIQRVKQHFGPDSEIIIAARGPQFDIVNLESLMKDLDIKVPWKYDQVEDLRTMMKRAGIKSADVDKPEGFVAHDASWDAVFQNLCWFKVMALVNRHG